MGRSLFSSQNKIMETYSFPTNKNGVFYWYIDKHDPNNFPVPFGGGGNTTLRRHRFDVGDGSLPIVRTNTQNLSLPTTTATVFGVESHTYSDSSVKNFTIQTDRLDQIKSFCVGFSNIANNGVFTGKTNLDLTPFTKIQFVNFQRNSNITGVTFNTDGTQPLYSIYGNQCDLRGVFDVSGLNLNDFDTFNVALNFNLNKIIFPSNANVKGNFTANNCSLSGHYDFTGWSGVGSQFNWSTNNITGFTFPTINTVQGSMFNGILVSNNNLTGTVDLSPLKNCGRIFRFTNNPNLTKVIFPNNTINCVEVSLNACNIGDIDISGVSGLTVTSSSPTSFNVGANINLSAVTTTDGLNCFNNTTFETSFEVYSTSLPFFNVSGCTFNNGTRITFNNNPQLTYIELPKHPQSQTLNSIYGSFCPLLTNLDISAFNCNGSVTNITPRFEFDSCSLTGLTLASTNKSGQLHFNVGENNLSGVLDLSNYTGLMKFDVANNNNLTGLILPKTTSTQTLTNSNINGFSTVFKANNCDLGYIDLKQMSGVTLNSSSTIELQNNNMTSAEVNCILQDLTTTTWSGVVLNISGTNAAPDSSSGGCDGINSLNILTSPPRNWSVTTS